MKKEKNPKQAYIPTIEEMQCWYEDDLRREALKSLECENNKKIDGQGSFFKAFRRFEERNEKIPLDSKESNAYYKKYKAYVEGERANKGKKIQEIENLIEYERFFLRFERRVNRETNNYSCYGSNSATRYRVDRIEGLEKELETILKSSPEAWEFYYKRQLISDIESQHQQRLVPVPYVVKAKQKVIDSLNSGVPVYIVGHLGSGKTQLATEAAMDFTIQNRIQSELEEKMENWFSDNPNATEEDAIKKFREFNEERKLHYRNILTNGTKEEIESLQPLFISGSHNLTYEDMFVEKTLSLEHSFSKRSYKDYLNMIIVDFYDWMDEHKEKLEQMTDEEQLHLKIQIWKSFSDLLVASNSSFGTVIKKIEREILIAVKEGRPVIVDELNTIAMQNLIALNDILQRHAGSTAYITGVGPVLIKPGFGFIGTGNLSTQMVNYEGTNELNPAFKSRFVTIEYNYVPQKITGSLEDQEFPEKNELFRIIIAHLADKNGNIHLPDPKRTLEELFRFSQLCRVTQNVFMGKWKDNETQKDIGMDGPELRESVLSIRNILHVLDDWNQGEEKDLSKALWDSFISSITYPDDQNYILSQAVRFGFFPAAEGWKVETKGIGEATTTYDEIRTRPYHYVRPSIETLSWLDVVHLVFGKGPSRRVLTKGLKEIFEIDIDDSLRIDVKKYQKLDQQLSHLEHSKELLEYLEDNEGEKMKLNLSVDGKNFKNQVIDLRKKLNECKTNGVLDDGFEEQLNKLSQIEEELLAELIPYYRVYANSIKKTSMQIKPLKQLGAFRFDSFLQTALRINENLFITSSIDGKVQFFYIDTAENFSYDNEIQVEWSPPIKEIKETISFIYKLNDREILLLGVRGGVYLLSSDNFDKISNVKGQIKVKSIKIDGDFSGFGRCLAINDGLFVVENGEERLSLLEVKKEKDEYLLDFHKNIYFTIPNWTTFEKLNKDYFVVGTKVGELYFIKYENRQLTITEKINFLNDEIGKIRLLEDGNGKNNSLIVIGNKRHLKILSLYEDEKNVKIELNNLEGNLFDVQSEKGTAIILSKDGILYLLEENFGNWYLNEEAAIKDVFFTNALKLGISRYLLMDVEGKLNLLYIDRIDTPEDLWVLPLYQ